MTITVEQFKALQQLGAGEEVDAQVLQALQLLGLVCNNDGRWRLTEAGELVAQARVQQANVGTPDGLYHVVDQILGLVRGQLGLCPADALFALVTASRAVTLIMQDQELPIIPPIVAALVDPASWNAHPHEAEHDAAEGAPKDAAGDTNIN